MPIYYMLGTSSHLTYEVKRNQCELRYVGMRVWYNFAENI